MARTKKPEKRKPIHRPLKVASAVKRVYEGRASAGPLDRDTPVTVDRRRVRERRGGPDRRQEGAAGAAVAVERRKLQRRAKVNRRRQIDPTTCERDYSADEIEFMTALDQYKRTSGRMFPTCSEILEVIRNLGYEKRPAAPPALPAPPVAAPLDLPSPPPATTTA